MVRRQDAPPRDLYPTDEEIVQRAYELCFEVRDLNDRVLPCLEAAESELLDRGARRALAALKNAKD